MRPIYRRITVPTPELPLEGSVNLYLVAWRGQAILIDAGWNGSDSLARLKPVLAALGHPNVTTLVLTHGHRDHAGAVGRLCEEFACDVLFHPDANEDVERHARTPVYSAGFPPSGKLMLQDLEISLLHAPGHARGHLHVHLPQLGVLFVGDNVMAHSSTWIGYPEGSMSQYFETLRQILTLRPRLLAPGHGRLILNSAARVSELIQRRTAREQEILTFLGYRPSTVRELTHALYGDVRSRSGGWVAEATVRSHLEHLREQRRAFSERPEDEDAPWNVLRNNV